MELKKATPIKVLMENAAEEFPPGCDPGLVAEYKEKMTRMCEAAEHELNETFSIMKGIVLERSNIIRVLREGGNDPGANSSVKRAAIQADMTRQPSCSGIATRGSVLSLFFDEVPSERVA